MQRRWLGAIAVTFVCAGCASSPPHVEGRIASGDGYLGDWDLFPNDCQAASEGETPQGPMEILLTDGELAFAHCR